MLYTTLNFVFFIVALLSVFYITGRKYRWIVLLAAGAIFYFLLSKFLILHIIIVSSLTWFIASRISRLFTLEKSLLNTSEDIDPEDKKNIKKSYSRKRTGLLLLGCIILFGSLLFFKFYNPIADSLLSETITFKRIIIPVGISFYTLQIGSYLFDVYNRNVTAEKNILRFILFSSYFPGILQGPISRYKELSNELKCIKEYDHERFVTGFIKVLWGYFKKMIIADRLFVLTSAFFGNIEKFEGFTVFLFAIVNLIRIYTDFSGGIDISVGISKMLGIDLVGNFNLPFFSKNISEFWRRWHITLGTWLKDYVFFPLSFSKPMSNLSKSLRKLSVWASRYLPSILCMVVLWFCSAVWHGEGVKFLFWGAFHWFFITLDILFEKKLDTGISKMKPLLKKLTNGIRMVATFILVSVGELIFSSATLKSALGAIVSIFRPWNFSILSLESLQTFALDIPDLLVGVIAIILLFAVELLIYLQLVPNPAGSIYRKKLPVRWLILLFLIFIIVIFGVYGYGYDPIPFEYFKF